MIRSRRLSVEQVAIAQALYARGDRVCDIATLLGVYPAMICRAVNLDVRASAQEREWQAQAEDGRPIGSMGLRVSK